MKRLAVQFLLIFAFVTSLQAQSEAIRQTQKIINEVIEKSFPELKNRKIEVKTFRSESDYFKARFSFSRYLTFQKMQYLVSVNPKVFERAAPSAGIRAIIAHELAHVLYYTQRNRFELLGLVNLSARDFTQKFERRADLEAIVRGYGDGLIEYRKWLYQNLPSAQLEEKKRNYYSPEEIELMLEILRKNPARIDPWRKNPPRNLAEIRQ